MRPSMPSSSSGQARDPVRLQVNGVQRPLETATSSAPPPPPSSTPSAPPAPTPPKSTGLLEKAIDVAAAQLGSHSSLGHSAPPLGTEQYKALHAYAPQNADELELKEGDILCVVERCDDGWFIGTSLRSGLFGTFPGNYVAPSS